MNLIKIPIKVTKYFFKIFLVLISNNLNEDTLKEKFSTEIKEKTSNEKKINNNFQIDFYQKTEIFPEEVKLFPHSEIVKKNKTRKITESLESSILKTEEKIILDSINNLHKFLTNIKGLENNNETYFNSSFQNIFNLSPLSSSIHDYFTINRKTFFPSTDNKNKNLILKDQKFWILWIEFISLFFEMRKKIDLNISFNKNENLNSSDNSQDLSDINAYKVVFGIFNHSLQISFEIDHILDYYSNYLKALPLENIIFIEKYLLQKNNSSIDKKYKFLNDLSNEIISNYERNLQEKRKKINQEINFKNSKESKEMNISNIEENKKDLYNINKVKKLNSEKKENKSFKNIYKEFIENNPIDDAENEILNEKINKKKKSNPKIDEDCASLYNSFMILNSKNKFFYKKKSLSVCDLEKDISDIYEFPLNLPKENDIFKNIKKVFQEDYYNSSFCEDEKKSLLSDDHRLLGDLLLTRLEEKILYSEDYDNFKDISENLSVYSNEKKIKNKNKLFENSFQEKINNQEKKEILELKKKTYLENEINLNDYKLDSDNDDFFKKSNKVFKIYTSSSSDDNGNYDDNYKSALKEYINFNSEALARNQNNIKEAINLLSSKNPSNNFNDNEIGTNSNINKKKINKGLKLAPDFFKNKTQISSINKDLKTPMPKYKKEDDSQNEFYLEDQNNEINIYENSQNKKEDEIKKISTKNGLETDQENNKEDQECNEKYRFFNKFSLKDYQIELLDWIEKKSLGKHGSPRGGIISIPMGTGKTFTTLCKIMMDYEKTKRPSLIICPKSIVSVWSEEIEKFFPEDEGKHLLVCENKTNLLKKFDIKLLNNVKIVITTYSFLLNMGKKREVIDKVISKQNDRITSIDLRRIPKKEPNYKDLYGDELLFEYIWENTVLDESHKVCNLKSKSFLTLMYLISKKKWCLTGNIIMNEKNDIKSQLMFLGMKIFQLDQMSDFSEFLFYREDINKLLELPDKNIMEETLDFAEDEQLFYNYYKSSYRKAYEKNYEVFDEITCMLVTILRFRQLCIHPILINSTKRKGIKSQGTIDFNKISDDIEISMPQNIKNWLFNELNINTTSTKIKRCVEIIKKVPNDEKIIIFSYFKETFIQIEHYMKLIKVNANFLKLTNDKSLTERSRIIDQYRYDPSIKILFVTFSLGSHGLNLFCANNIIMMDIWWNFATTDQAIARCYRNGQKRNVNIWILLINDSIDLFMKQLCEYKKDILFSITQNRPVEKDKKQMRILFEKILYAE